MLSRPALDRNSDIPLFRQLSVAIEMRIIDGELPDGTSLPSVRRLANELDVAPITVVQAYKALQAEGLVKAVPKRGYFVTIAPHVTILPEAVGEVMGLIDAAFDAAKEAGIEPYEFLRMTGERVRADMHGGQTVGIIGHRTASLRERVEAVREVLSDLKVNVEGVAFEDIEVASREEREARLGACDLFLVSVGEVERASALLGHRSSRIVPMTRVLRKDVTAFILAQPVTSRIGIIAENPAYAQRMLAELSRITSFTAPPRVAVVTDADQVRHVLEGSEAILIGSQAAARLGEPIPPETPSITFVFLPDEATLARLRGRLTAWSPYRV